MSAEASRKAVKPGEGGGPRVQRALQPGGWRVGIVGVAQPAPCVAFAGQQHFGKARRAADGIATLQQPQRGGG